MMGLRLFSETRMMSISRSAVFHGIEACAGRWPSNGLAKFTANSAEGSLRRIGRPENLADLGYGVDALINKARRIFGGRLFTCGPPGPGSGARRP